jgi:hypothetical protein
MDTSDEEEIQAESQQTPEQIAAGLGAKKKEQERLRNLVAQKQQTIKFASVKQSTSKPATKHKSGGEERKEEKGGEKKEGKFILGCLFALKTGSKKFLRLRRSKDPRAAPAPHLLAHRPLAHRRLPLRRNTGERAVKTQQMIHGNRRGSDKRRDCRQYAP